jgi:hypothetical protein
VSSKRRLKVRAQAPNNAAVSAGSRRVAVERESAMTPKIDDEGIERLIDIINDSELTTEAQERLHQEKGLWPLYESLRQTAYAAFVSSRQNR